jgi:DNA polymerase-3 subunit gamma/tau
MSLALYRKYRPQLFSEVLGQERVTVTLQQALSRGHVGHAYIFSGPRGTGKTSVARLLARAVNCEKMAAGKLIAGEPCNTCAACVRALAGQELDFIEIDAASNRGIDEIRELREKIRFSPGQGRKKVFLIDEFHMLTKEAFNALLKTLEEPPDHAVFILATTEIQNVPATILSRAQHFAFRALSLQHLMESLSHIAKQETIQLEEGARLLIAVQAEGGARDAQSLLELLMSAAGEKKITAQLVKQVLALPEISQLETWTRAVIEQDAAGAIAVLRTGIEQGTDPQQFARSLVRYLRGIALFQVSEQLGKEISAHLTEEQQKTAAELAAQMPRRLVLTALTSINQAGNETRLASPAVLPLEVATLSLISGPARRSPSSSKSGSDGADGVVHETPSMVAPKKNISTATHTSQAPQMTRQVEQPMTLPASDNLEMVDTEELTTLLSRWSEALQQIAQANISVAGLLRSAVLLTVEKGRAVFVVEYDFHRERLSVLHNRHMVEQVLEKMFNTEIHMECLLVRDLTKDQKEVYERRKRQKNAKPVAEKTTPASEALTQLAVDLLGGQVVE